MKKTLLSLFALVASSVVNAQAITIYEDCRDLSGRCLYYVEDELIVTNANESRAFRFHPQVQMKNDKLTCVGIIALMLNIGNCNEHDTLILLLEDGSKITLKSWNDFNCKGNSWYNIGKDDLALLRQHKIVKAQIQNGYSYESLVNDVAPQYQDYFFRFFQSLDENKPVKK
jgi:hypothetical protein